MNCRVITISRSMGAGGEEIGRAAAERLGLRYADEEIIVKAAEIAGVSPETVAEVESTPGLVARILEAMARTPPDPQGWSAAQFLATDYRAAYEGLIQRVIQETASAGDVVIVAHGASIPLAGAKGVLRVLVTASAATRTERLAREAGISEAQAGKAVRESDRQRSDYLRRFYDVSHELPTHYDLVLNTDALALPLCATLIVAAARQE